MQTQNNNAVLQELDDFKKLIFPQGSELVIKDRFNADTQNQNASQDFDAAICKSGCNGMCSG